MPQMNPCSGQDCDQSVKARRRSESGEHWCTKPACQAAKQRLYRARARAAKRAAADKVELTLDQMRRLFMKAAIFEPRRVCDSCGLENSVSGYAHRSGPQSRNLCDGTGGLGRELGPYWLDLIHPELGEDGTRT